MLDVTKLLTDRARAHIRAQMREEPDEFSDATSPEARETARLERERAEKAEAARRGMGELKARVAKDQQ
jgi:hypothetical protein